MVADASGDHSTAKLWALLGGIASLLSILTWLGASNAAELKDLLSESSPTGSPSTSAPGTSRPPAHISGDSGGSGDSGDSGDSGSSRGSGTSDTSETPDAGQGSDDKPDPGPTTPPPDPTEEAFKARSPGDCLPLYDTGRGGDTRIAWNVNVPPAPVSCSDGRALVRVTATDTTCPTGDGKSYWSYQSVTTGTTRTLCLSRVYHAYYCLLGRQSGDSITLGPMTAVACRREPVPVPYNQIMHIMGVYRAPAGATAANCRQSAGDRTRYWAWLMDDGATLLCTTIYQGG
ncbi:LppU/SCO3897 family protein [Streptomyces laurentii]|uniref:LppU/SCO3897 family protein n=1 Tax=Streptomyces laurentii TaxID=39478 RepID=UPI00368F32A1